MHIGTRYENNVDMASVFTEFFVHIGKTIGESCDSTLFELAHYMQGDFPN